MLAPVGSGRYALNFIQCASRTIGWGGARRSCQAVLGAREQHGFHVV